MLDLVRLTDDRWVARVVFHRGDGTSILLEEILVSRSLPNVEAAIEVRDGGTCLVLRDRDQPERVLAHRCIDRPATLRIVPGDGAAAARASGPTVPA